ncbi:ammonium transporter AmtB-like domain-containing protein [Sordaria brevicollis]|uniref:Ammonium transporter AmtB-like domain-containing protein n=1 Tax=Sordaria brevicollis TaxID=83679 RepID=A0AAE0NWG8_SORBR|nr:ammonium transporter AmtB-like domain-containing protein [Sordaria brevicollis]
MATNTTSIATSTPHASSSATSTHSAAAAAAAATSSPKTNHEVNLYHDGDISFLILCTALILLMIPGVGFFYSGLSRRKSALSLMFLSILACAVTCIQWFIWGYSLSFSHNVTKSGFVGTLSNAFYIDVLDGKVESLPHEIPDLLFATYESFFSAMAVVLAAGAVAERGRLLPCVVFMFVWATLVYDPVACWTWNPHGNRGWAYAMGVLDWGGGTPVHIVGGCASLAYSMVLGKRKGHGTHELNYRPHNVASVVIGTVFLWVGWFGFNAGSALAANMRAVVAAANTNLAACVGGITCVSYDDAGFVPVWAAVPFGILGAALANYGTKIKFLCNIDDALDTFAVHTVAGLVGNILTGIFACKHIAHLDQVTVIDGGWVDHNWKQPIFQLAGSFAGGVYSFVMTAIIVFALDHIPGMSLRVSETAEVLGIDDSEIGEFAYDYVELTREMVIDHVGGGSIMDGNVGETGSMSSRHQHTQYPNQHPHQHQQIIVGGGGRSVSPTTVTTATVTAAACGASGVGVGPREGAVFGREDTKDSGVVFGNGPVVTSYY